MIKEMYLNLVEAIKNSPETEYIDDDLKSVLRAMNSFSSYVLSVYNMETNIPIIRFRYEGEELREKIQNLDENRRLTHESAIANVSLLNNICRLYNVDEIFTGDKTDRYQVADFCEEVVSEFFKDRSGVNKF